MYPCIDKKYGSVVKTKDMCIFHVFAGLLGRTLPGGPDFFGVDY
jgi:hypothetical protein